MDDNLNYINELLSSGNEVVITDIANILLSNLDYAKSLMESLINTHGNNITHFYLIYFLDNGVYTCKKVDFHSLDKYPDDNPSLYSIKLSNDNGSSKNDLFDAVLKKLASAKSSDSIFIPISCNITNPSISIRRLSTFGSDSKKNTSSGTSFDIKTDNQTKITPASNNKQINQIKDEKQQTYQKPNIFISKDPVKRENTIENAFSNARRMELDNNNQKRDYCTMNFESKLKISPVKAIKNDNNSTNCHKPEQSLFDQSDDFVDQKNFDENFLTREASNDENLHVRGFDVRSSTNEKAFNEKKATIIEDNCCKSPQTKKFTVSEKVPKQSTYVENGYFVMEDYEEVVKVEREIAVNSVDNITNISMDNTERRRSQTSITSFFKVMNK